MKTHRSLFALFLIIFSVAPAIAGPAPAAHAFAAPNSAPERVVDSSRAGRSAPLRLSPAIVASVTPATTVAPVPVTTTPPTTQSPTARLNTAKALVPKLAEPSPSPVSSSGGNQSVVSIAQAQVGKAYRSGATGPNAFDCSGLVYYVFNQAGIAMPRLTSGDFLPKYQHVSRGDLQPGDIIVFPGHVGIYIGNGKMVHASTPRGGVKLSPMNSAGSPSGYVRIQ